MSTWDYLPLEIRAMILGELELHPQKGAYAAVSKEWQVVIEKSTFRRLKLKETCLDEFDRITQRRRGLVRHVCLDIELKKYTCRCCERWERETWARHNYKLATLTLYKLFSILSTWGPTREGLTLELNAYSPSDKEHWFKTFYYGTLEEDKLLDSGLPLDTNEIDDPKHGWVKGRQVSSPPNDAVRRIFALLEINFPDQLPQVAAVTKFLLRRQCRRQWTPPTLQRIWEKLPRLEEIIYEPWQLCNKVMQGAVDNEYHKLVTSHLPMSLKKVSVFEDFNETLLSIFENSVNPSIAVFAHINEIILSEIEDPTDPLPDLFPHEDSFFDEMNPDRVRVTSRRVAEGFAARSLGLEQLSVAFMVEAQYFMDAAKKNWTWHELRSLSLTSRLISRESSSEVISRLLHDAGAVALHMPKLEMMNIWNGAQGEACTFMYRQKDSSVTWRGTWEFRLSHDVLQSWKKVVARFARDELRVKHQLLGCEILSHGDAIHDLDLAFVIDPVSLMQILRENENS
ncbi:unnamed protein product [Clonostachys rosea f. rosea IK726]|uniref:DUF6546 domain-containing protein n=2 Tax=Bionectria ochroleuca TaxID=29856 RepID=A0A0B7JQ73_BIOOC|nr:unnamed protein product [Clonostachys rosea f. rosea IK726]